MTARVLVVDDSVAAQEMVGLHLEKAGYTVKRVNNGAQAVEMTKQWSPSLILLDVMMPVMNGYSATREIREFSSTPIIMLSAMGSEDNKIQGLNAGADDYIVKPFSSQELMARTRSLLRRSKSHSKNEVHHKIFQHGDLTIDVERGLVKIAGEGISFTETEFKLIVVLADAMGEAVKSEHLLTMIWGPKYTSVESILTGTIRRIRTKIEKDPDQPVHILSCDGKGYRMPPIFP
jgi:two-component system response regulator MtrA